MNAYDEGAGTEPAVTTPDDGTSTTVFTARDGYTVEPPPGWIRNGDSKDKGGFTESRWHLAGSPSVYVLVDHTAGYGGTALDGARSVRNAILERPRYTEYVWDRVDDHTWLWEFGLDGARKIDRFITACGDGFAALGAAPAAEFEDYRATIEAFTASLTAPCEQHSSSSGATAPTEVSPPTNTTPTEVSPSSAPTASRSSPSGVLRRHFQRLNAGDYDGAFELLSTRYRARNANWSAQPGQARPYLNVIEVGPTKFGRGVAFVHVKFYGHDRVDTPRSDTQCRRFEGDARMVEDGRVWRYDPTGSFRITKVPSSLGVCNP